MSAHYKQPILLIEFEEHKSFSLEVRRRRIGTLELANHASLPGRGRCQVVREVKVPAQEERRPARGHRQLHQLRRAVPSSPSSYFSRARSPRVRVLWSSSPYAPADVFNDLKAGFAQPDPARAVLVGAEEDPDAGAGVNTAAEELLRALPGVSAKNVKHVMSRVGSVRELCELGLPEVQEILGVEPGKACWDFLHRG